MAGKWDRDRVIDFNRYKGNYVLIDWSSSDKSSKKCIAEDTAGREAMAI